MSEYLDDVRRYDSGADEAVVEKIVKYLGIALRNRDSSKVSCTQKSETDRVRKNFLQKKLGLTDGEAELEAVVQFVCKEMSGDRMKNRVTFYYLAAKKVGKLSVFA